ncbi:XdhC/CoxI family protein [Bacillus sp. B15-48]|uniref:XdhC family protein n=1 Tax=Bacillus sp. B15-48 TaxID=1548601 RepID=UPI00193F8269|nr:XdhC/CoxI family protein [Bacillus sp. B15-48]MBM4763648.1 XdhC/CoxI family protein [Bacillus sp. B15-48]
MHEIYEEIIRCKESGINGVLGTIVSTKGSTYQKTGTKCFISEDGKLTGLMSGGCVEGDLAMIANEVIENEHEKIVHYDFMDDGDLIWGLGLGCNGKMNIFLEPYLPERKPEKAQVIEEWFRLGQEKTTDSIVIIDSEDKGLIGKRWVIRDEQKDLRAISYQEVAADYLDQKGLQPATKTLEVGGKSVDVFYDYISPPLHLAVYGAGPDAVPLVRIAKELKWRVTVMDHRPKYINKDNFPLANSLIQYPSGETPNLEIDDNTYIVLMSHHFIQDQLMFEKIIHSPAAYIGLLGPRKRTMELSKGIVFEDTETLKKIHSPIGLDIGSKTPEEIALSIIAEITLVYRGGTGRKMTEKLDPFNGKMKKDDLLWKA